MRWTKTLQERFEDKFIKTDGCWNWTAYKDKRGYGAFLLAGHPKLAHRVSYQLYVGEIPDGLCVCHRCDNPACVRPDHLFLGTVADNMRDRTVKGRGGDHAGERNGRAKLTIEQVIEIRARYSNGARRIDLAKEFGVTPTNISFISRGRHWTKSGA